VPAGPFSMGEEKHTIDVPYAYWIGQFPVTQAQFAAFTNEGGYETEKWWTPGGWKYIQEEGRRAPRPRGYPFDLPNHPAYRITWYEAQAFVTWLKDRALREGWIPAGGRLVLPNEPEWEKAARGGHAVPEPVLVPVALARLHSPSIDVRLRKNPHPGRRYPWGDVIDPGCCNYDETKIGSTSSPGCFSANPSPYGVQEMSGNVREWSRTVYGKADYRKQVTKWIESEILTEGASRVLRGGSFSSNANFARCASRGNDVPGSGDSYVGFRVVFAPP
jgi:formylglycine-generating enzyme required for sulfatase activity